MSDARLPIVIVGSGAAGMTTALAAAPANVRLLCRDDGGSGTASMLAQGGIAAALKPDDSPEAHARDTLVAGSYHNNVAVVNWLTQAAPQTITWLESQGVQFDRDTDGALQLGREGGHSTARIVHAGGDATGAEVVRALSEKVKAAEHIDWQSGVDVDALLMRGERVAGVRVRDGSGQYHEIEAAAVVLATGGIGSLFARTSNPPGATGAGLALAQTAHAQLQDIEFIQFHPTGLAVEGQRLPLLTEALRGAGARLLGDAGESLMDGVHPQRDLAPRDVVARRVWREQQRGGKAWLDGSAITGDWAVRFPTVLAGCKQHGYDPRREWLPITPVAHFYMGGVKVDLDGQTSVAGLHAAGEVACNGAHGANRLASNSLLEAVACGRRLGSRLGDRLVSQKPPVAAGTYHWVEQGPGLSEAGLATLRELLWQSAGPVREATALRDAWRICKAGADNGWQMRFAQALVRAARVRKDSLGAHFREDICCPA